MIALFPILDPDPGSNNRAHIHKGVCAVIMIRFLFLSDTMSDHHEIDLTFVEINLTSLIK